jgi:hypothetical protein
MKTEVVGLVEKLSMFNLPSDSLKVCQVRRNHACVFDFQLLPAHITEIVAAKTCHVSAALGLLNYSFALVALPKFFVSLQKLYDIFVANSIMLLVLA